MIDTLRLTAEGAMRLLERRELSPAELHAAYVAAIAERDGDLHCYLRTSVEPSGKGSAMFRGIGGTLPPTRWSSM